MRRIAIAAVMALVTMVILPGSASAWDQFPCDSGELNADAAWVGAELPRMVHIPGVVGCGVSVPGPAFAVVVFEPGVDYGYYSFPLLRPYASPTGPTMFEVVGALREAKTDPIALCVMPDEKSRLSCVLVSPDLMVTQLPTSDPRVVKDIREDNGQVSPACATCFTIAP